MTQENDLINLLAMLKVARQAYEDQREIQKRVFDEFDKALNENQEYKLATENALINKNAVDELESSIKEISVALYKANPDGGKHLAGGNVTIKEMTNAEITDLEAAREWANKEAPAMIILDEKAVIKHAKAVKNTVPLKFVKITVEPEAQISSKLEFSE